MKSVEKNCPLIKFVGLIGVSCLGHKRPKMLKNSECQAYRVDTILGQCGGLVLRGLGATEEQDEGSIGRSPNLSFRESESFFTNGQPV